MNSQFLFVSFLCLFCFVFCLWQSFSRRWSATRCTFFKHDVQLFPLVPPHALTGGRRRGRIGEVTCPSPPMMCHVLRHLFLDAAEYACVSEIWLENKENNREHQSSFACDERNMIEQDRRWNTEKPSAALDPYIPTWLTTSPANHRPANFWFFFFFFYIQRKLWKVVQPQVQLMSINFKFEVPILWLFQVQIIIKIIY